MTQAVSIADDTLLRGFPILRTDDLSEAREVVGRAFCDHRLDIRHGSRLSVSHDHVSGSAVSLNALSYGAEVEIDPGQLDRFYLLQFPLTGAARVRHRGMEVEASPRMATILNPDRDTRMIWGEGCRKLLLQVDRRHLEQVAATMMGGSTPGPIRFDPQVDLARPEGRQLMQRVVAAAKAATRGALWAGKPGLREAWAERELAEELLLLQPSNVSHMLRREAPAPLSREMRRAVEFIRANLSEPLRIDDIAAQAGLNVRSLQIGFKATFGKSPMRYLRDARLDMARYRLSRRHNRESVTEVAYSSGFSHLGRFSRDYRARFGISPSEAE